MKIFHGSQSIIKVPQYGIGKVGLKSRFAINVDAYDVIIGYRADDSYFDFAEAFLNNSISVEQLSVALRLGKLGEQIVVKSKEAFKRLKFSGFTVADHTRYYPSRQSRNDEAGREFENILGRGGFSGLYMNTILAERIGNDDERIPRNTSL